jgi:hypothetical protein
MNQQSTEHTIPPQEDTISLEEAADRTTQWRNLFNVVDKTQVVQTPASIFISYEDLNEIISNFGPSVDPNFAGIRLYLTVHDAEPTRGLYPVTGAVVPTTTITNRDGSQYFQDVIVPVPLAGGGEGVSIYDFTQPCPSFCQGTTPELTGS